MAIRRLDNVLIVVDDLDAVIAFFLALGLELEGRGPLDWPGAERVIGLTGVRQEIAMLRVPDGPGRIELARFHQPEAITPVPAEAPANTLGLRRVMFAVDDLHEVVGRMRQRGAELVGEIVRFEDVYLLCYLRGPEGIVVGLAEQLS
ncbi:VOC family protein [Kitasatospora sp. NPDC096147]|uniref:VOC family protein n=1 Tax=Kitasatospora sp. NPDC096147 TaxID=3364093 RepID=UPI0037F67E9B